MEVENDDVPGEEMNQNGEEQCERCLSSYVDGGSVETHRHYLSRKTTLEMLRDRGYHVPATEIDLTLADFRAIHGPELDRDRLKFSVTHSTDTSKRVLVIFCPPEIVKIHMIRGITTLYIKPTEGLTGLILIVQNKVTSQALKSVNLLPLTVEIFKITDLLVNVTKHVLKPKHQVLTDREKQDLLKKYSVEEKQLPRMLQKDAIARYYGLKRGQVVKVTYGGEFTQMHVTYRCVW